MKEGSKEAPNAPPEERTRGMATPMTRALPARSAFGRGPSPFWKMILKIRPFNTHTHHTREWQAFGQPSPGRMHKVWLHRKGVAYR